MTIMNRKTKFTLTLASLILALALRTEAARAAEAEIVCTPVYGGGQICGAHTPVATGAETEILYSLSTLLYATGLGSFVIAKNAGKFISLK